MAEVSHRTSRAVKLAGAHGTLVNTGTTNDSFGVTLDFVVRELIPAISR